MGIGQTDKWLENMLGESICNYIWMKNFRMTREAFQSLPLEIQDLISPDTTTLNHRMEKELAIIFYYLKDKGSLWMTTMINPWVTTPWRQYIFFFIIDAKLLFRQGLEISFFFVIVCCYIPLTYEFGCWNPNWLQGRFFWALTPTSSPKLLLRVLEIPLIISSSRISEIWLASTECIYPIYLRSAIRNSWTRILHSERHSRD